MNCPRLHQSFQYDARFHGLRAVLSNFQSIYCSLGGDVYQSPHQSSYGIVAVFVWHLASVTVAKNMVRIRRCCLSRWQFTTFGRQQLKGPVELFDSRYPQVLFRCYTISAGKNQWTFSFVIVTLKWVIPLPVNILPTLNCRDMYIITITVVIVNSRTSQKPEVFLHPEQSL